MRRLEERDLRTPALEAAAALWALSGLLAAGLFARGIDPIGLVAGRTWVATVGLVALVAARRSSVDHLAPGLTVAYGLATAAANGLLFASIERLPVAIALVLQNTAPVFAVLGAAALTRRADPRALAAVGLTTAGVALVAGVPGGQASADPLGLLLGVATGAAVALFSALGARASVRHGALPALAGAYLVASAAWVAVLTVTGRWATVSGTRPGDLAVVVVIGVVGTLAPAALYAWGSARAGASAGTVVICLEPLFGAVLAWVWLGQGLGAGQLWGGGLLVVTVWWLQRRLVPATARRQDVPA